MSGGVPPPLPPPGSGEAEDGGARLKAIADEREYLEGLLNARFNYYLVFASIVLLAAFGSSDLPAATRAAILGAGSLISALIAYSVGRTRHLLQVLLDALAAPESNHPYRLAKMEVKSRFYRRNANAAIELVVWLLTALFLAAALYLAAWGMPGASPRGEIARRTETISVAFASAPAPQRISPALRRASSITA
jgi:hypothetical protein